MDRQSRQTSIQANPNNQHEAIVDAPNERSFLAVTVKEN